MVYLNNFSQTIDVLVSSCGERLSYFLESLPSYQQGVFYLIAHQKHDGYTHPILNQRVDIKYFPIDSVGVTKSRNFLIRMSSSDLIWFCDDDVTILDDFSSTLRKSHYNDSSPVITFIVNNEMNEPRKRFPSMEKICTRNYFSILSVGTIEISCKSKYFDSSNIFPEDMGAGALYPIGDEAVFLSSFVRQGKKIKFHPIAVCIHPDESSGLKVSDLTIYSRGLTIRYVFKWFGFFLLFPFFLSRIKLFRLKNHSLVASFLIFIRGFFLCR